MTTYAISDYHHWCCEYKSHSGEVCSTQHYVIKFVSVLRQVVVFSVYSVSSTNKTDSHDITKKIVESGIKHHNLNSINTYNSKMRHISYLSSKASFSCNSFGWWHWFITLISFFTANLSKGYGVLMNLATKTRPVDFSTHLWTTPKAPLQIKLSHIIHFSDVFHAYTEMTVITDDKRGNPLSSVPTHSFSSGLGQALHFSFKKYIYFAKKEIFHLC